MSGQEAGSRSSDHGAGTRHAAGTSLELELGELVVTLDVLTASELDPAPWCPGGAGT